jgi:signal transduction histidine kinase
MTLLRKFGVLLGVLGLVVVLNLGSAVWAVSLLEREVTGYLQSISTVLGGLNRIKRNLGELGALLPLAQELEPWTTEIEPSTTGTPADRARQLGDAVRAELLALDRSHTFQARSGISTQRNLESRIGTALDQARAWVEGGDRESGLAARRSIFVLHELIERNETKILGDSSAAVAHGRDLRGRVLTVMFMALAVGATVAMLGLILVRRWVLRPVDRLRRAADRIARGDFAHRVPVQGGDELARLSAEINHMAGMISAMQEERVDRERLVAAGEVVRRLAHNLRNPLAGIRGLAELSKGELPPHSAVQENQDRIVATVDRFERWLADLLRGTTPLRIQPEVAAARPWLEGLVESLRPMAAARGVSLEVQAADAPQSARFDPLHLEHAVVAVVTNAIQASPRGTTVDIRAQRGTESWEIRVKDRGPGVPPDLAEKIFRPYFTTKRDGTGIGLAVAKQVVEQHGGRIEVQAPAAESGRQEEQEQGAVFVFRLPLTGGPEGPTLARFGQSGGGGGQDSDRRGRGEPAVLGSADAEARRA